MDWSFLAFLVDPRFVIPWYAVGLAGMLGVIADLRRANTVLKPAISWAWPIIVFFFSVLGLALYLGTARAPGLGAMKTDAEKQQAHHEYERSMWRRVNGAVIHCVAGDGLGIMTAMVIARAGGLGFWQEFWLEYLVGFGIGWFVFQRKSMAMMTGSLARQLAMSFRAEFFSMLTVMGGMGAVMAYLTPMVATQQPKPLTFAFWSFGMLGLLAGYLLTFPMNWMMVELGWKHGMGDAEGAKPHQVATTPQKAGRLAAMTVLGCAALLLPAWLTAVRERAGAALAAIPAGQSPAEALASGLRASIDRGLFALARGDRTRAAVALDDALRAAEVGAHAAPGAFYSALEQLRGARLALQDGNPHESAARLMAAEGALGHPSTATPPLLEVGAYLGAHVIDARGAVIGEVTAVSGGALRIALGGWRDAWGFVDFSAGQRITVPASAVTFGPPTRIGMRMLALPIPPPRA